MFIAVLFINYENLEVTKNISVGELMDKFKYIQTTEYYSALKRNKQSSNEKTWSKLKCILLRKRSQSVAAKC